VETINSDVPLEGRGRGEVLNHGKHGKTTEGTEDGSFRGLRDSRLVPGFPPVLDDRWQRQDESYQHDSS
jgi:hypothetical protein